MKGTCAFIFRWISFIEGNKDRFLIALILLVISTGVVYSIYLGKELRYLPDEQDYYNLGTNTAKQHFYSTDGIIPTAYRPPGYPFVIAVLRVFGASVVSVRMLNFIFLSLSIFVLFKTLKSQSSPRAAIIGAFLVLAYPVLFYTAGTLYPQTFAALLFLLIIYIYTCVPGSLHSYLFGGLLFGFLILTVPTFVFTLFIILIWIWFHDRRLRFQGIIITLIAASLIVGCWVARNYSVFHSFVFVSTNSGENLLLGNSELTRSNQGMKTDISAYQTQAAQMNEVERDQFFRRKALDFLRNHKLQAGKLYVQKVVNYFNFRNELVTRSEGSIAKDLLMLGTYGSLLLIFIIRLLLIGLFKPSPFEILMIGLYLSNAFFGAIFFNRIRFRLPFDYLLIMIVAIMVDLLVKFLASRYNVYSVHKNQTQVV